MAGENESQRIQALTAAINRSTYEIESRLLSVERLRHEIEEQTERRRDLLRKRRLERQRERHARQEA